MKILCYILGHQKRNRGHVNCTPPGSSDDDLQVSETLIVCQRCQKKWVHRCVSYYGEPGPVEVSSPTKYQLLAFEAEALRLKGHGVLKCQTNTIPKMGT